MSDSAGTSDTARPPRWLRYAVWWLGGFMLLVLTSFIPQGWMSGFSARDSGSAGIAGLDTASLQMVGIAAVYAILPIVQAMTPWRRAFGVAAPTPNPAARLIGATAMVVAVQTAVGVAASWLSSDGASGSVGDTYSGYSASTHAAAGFFAGVTEETLDIVVPTTLALLVLVTYRRMQVYRAEPLAASIDHVIGAPRTWMICVAACTIGLVTRLTDHLYQGSIHAAAAVIWGTGLLAVYAVYRSVLPLMIGHFFYDFAVAGVAPIHSWTAFAVYLGGAAVIAGAATMWTRSRPRPH